MRMLGLSLALSIVLGVPAAAQSATELRQLLTKAYTAFEAGRYEEAVEICVPCFENESIELHARGACAWMMARVHSLRGEIEPALEWYERCSEVGFSLAEIVEIDPALANLRRDPRFARHLEDLAAAVERRRQERTAEALAWRAALERVNERIRTSSMAWTDGHLSRVRRVRLTRDGARAVTWAEDGSAWLWNAWTGEPLGMLGVFAMGETVESMDGQAARWPDLDFSPDGERVLLLEPMAGFAGLWDGRSAEFLGYVEDGEQVVRAAAFGPDGHVVVTADQSGAVRCFDAGSGLPLQTPRLDALDVSELSFSPDGSRILAFTSLNRGRLWDRETGTLLGELGSAELPLMQAYFNADGTRVLAVSNNIGLSYGMDEATGRLGEPTILRAPEGNGVDWGAGGDNENYWRSSRIFHSHRVHPPGERLIVMAPHGGPVSLWDADGKALASLKGLRSVPSSLPWFGFSPDGQRLLTINGGTAQLWSAATGELLADLAGEEAPFDASFGTFSPSGRRLATVSVLFEPPELPRMYDGRTGKLIGEEQADSQVALHFSDTDRLGLSYGDRGSAKVWDGDGESVLLQAHVTSMVGEGLAVGRPRMSPDGRQAVSFGWNASGPGSHRVWDVRTGSTSRDLSRAGSTSGQFIEGGRLLLVSGAGRVELLDAESGVVRRSVDLEGDGASDILSQVVVDRKASRLLTRRGTLRSPRADLHDLTDGKRLATLPLADRYYYPSENALLRHVAISPRGDVAAVTLDAGVRFWDLATGAELELLPGLVRDLEFSPDGRLLACASYDRDEVLVFDVDERRLLHSFEGHAGTGGFSGPVRFVGFDPGGGRVVSVGFDGTARICDLSGEEQTRVLGGHAGLLNRLVFAPDGTRVLTTSDDGTARLWDASTGALLAVLEGHIGPVEHGEYSADGSRILTMGMDASTRIWNGEDGRLLATRVEYDDGWLVFEPGGHYLAGGRAAEHAHALVKGRRYPLSSYSAIYESPEKVAQSLAGRVVRPPSFVPQAPEVRVAAPLDPLVPERKFRMEVLIEDAYGIESVRVVQDGRELDAEWLGEHLTQNGKTARLSCDLELPAGSNQTTIRIRATNARKIQSVPRTVFARWEPPQRELYLLALGVADYDDDRLDLAYPTKDADDLIARFAGEEGGYYKQVNAQRLVNTEVTPGKLRKAREEFLLRAQPEDTIVVFAAGHGVRSESGEYYFLTPGTTPDDPYDGIERQMLESLVTWDKLHARRRILLLDTCHSGEAFGEGKRGVALSAFDQTAVNEAAGTGLYIIAASSEQGFAQEMEGNGLFTRCLLEGLDGAADANKDGLVGIDELKAYATTAVHERSGGRQRPTAPKIEGGEDFPVARTP